MVNSEYSAFSRRDAIRLGIGGAVALSAVDASMADSKTAEAQIVVRGVQQNEAATFLVNVSSGKVSSTPGEVSVHSTKKSRQFRLPDKQELINQSESGDLLVLEKHDDGSELLILNGHRERKTSVPFEGQLLEACYSGDGQQIAIIEGDDRGFRLVVFNARGGERTVLNESAGMRGASWSPCNTYVGVVAYDWQQTEGSGGFPAPASHRIELFSGTRRTSRLAHSCWLDRVDWAAC